jgi:tetratricopeptide (TPR) repeat protein
MQSNTIQSTSLLEMAHTKAFDTILNVYQEHSIEAIVEVADFLRHQDTFNIALPLYQYLLQQQETADFYYGIGQCYGKAYQYEIALTYLKKAFELQNDRLEGANYYAYILERNLLMDQAEHWYQKALSTDYANDLWTLSHYAYFLEKNHKAALAEQAYQAVLNRNPNYTWATKRYALFLLKQNQLERSLQLMQTAIEQYPNNPFVQLNYLEYLIIREDAIAYEAHLQSLDYPNLVLPFQVLIDLFGYFQRYLLQKTANLEKLVAYQKKAQSLKETIHRDFDDLNQLLAENNGDLATWQQMTQLLVK